MSSGITWDTPTPTPTPKMASGGGGGGITWDTPKNGISWDAPEPAKYSDNAVDRARLWAGTYKPGTVSQPLPDLAALIDQAANKYGVPRAEARAIAGIESAGGRNAGSSSAGALGVFQIMPATAKGFGYTVQDLMDPRKNIDLGVRYFARLKKQFGGDPYMAAMAYNMGSNGLRSAWGTPEKIPLETRQYAAKLYAALNDPNFVPQTVAQHPQIKKDVAQAVHGPVQEAGIGQGLLQFGKEALGVGDKIVRTSADIQNKVAGETLAGINDVLGAPQRAVQGAVYGAGKGGVKGAVNEGVYSFFHPNDANAQSRETQHLIELMHLPQPQGQEFHNKVIRFLEQFGAQTATDPLTYIPVLGWLGKGIKTGAEGLEALNRLEETMRATEAEQHFKQLAQSGRATMAARVQQAMRRYTQSAHEVFGRRPELERNDQGVKLLTGEGKSMRLSVEQKYRTMESQKERADQAMLAPLEEDLHKLKSGQKLPDEVRMRYLEEPWQHGTAEMRAQAEALGFKPKSQGGLVPDDVFNAQKRAYPNPTGVLKYNVRNDYQTMIRPKAGQTWEQTPFMQTVGGKHKEEIAGFEKQREAEGALPEDQFELVKNRLRLGRTVVRQRLTDQETAQMLSEHGDMAAAAYRKIYGLPGGEEGNVFRYQNAPGEVQTGPSGGAFFSKGTSIHKNVDFYAKSGKSVTGGPHLVSARYEPKNPLTLPARSVADERTLGEKAADKLIGYEAKEKILDAATKSSSEAARILAEHGASADDINIVKKIYARGGSAAKERAAQIVLERVVKDAATKAGYDAVEMGDEVFGFPGTYKNAASSLAPEYQAKIDLLKRTGGGWWDPSSPIDVGKLSHAPKRYLMGSPLRAASRIQKTAIAFNPLPHGLKNVGQLAYLHGGPEAFGNGLKYAMHGLDEAQQSRLVNLGLDAEYVRDLEGPLKAAGEYMAKKTGLKENPAEIAHQLSSKTLTRLEGGYRQALLDQLDKKWGPSSMEKYIEKDGERIENPDYNPGLEYRKADYIRKALGDYRNTSAFVNVLEGLGGPFLAFRLGIVPESVTKALLRNPQRAEAIARGQSDVNDQFFKGTGSEFELGGPLSDMSELAFDPEKYLTSSASIGFPLHEVMRFADPNQTKTLGDIMDDLGTATVPYFNALEDSGAMHQLIGGYGSSPGIDARTALLLSLLGAYARKKPSPRAHSAFVRRENKAQ